ncbi:carbon-nitrogen hydrolase family protein [Blastococcus sp. SYSU D00669]
MTRIGLAQWHPRPGATADNLAHALERVAELAGRGCAVVVLPELWPSGYDPASLTADVAASAEPLDGPRGRALAAAAREHGVWLFAGSVPEARDGAVFNTAPVYAPSGDLVAAHRKVHLYTGEDSVFAAGGEVTVVDAGPLGRAGVSICFDGDLSGYSRALRERGARVVVSVSAYEVAAERWWDLLHPAQALAHGQWWLMVNQCGGSGPTALLGGSRVLTPLGEVVAEAPRVHSGRADALLVVDVDVDGGIAEWDRTSSLLWTAGRKRTYA